MDSTNGLSTQNNLQNFLENAIPAVQDLKFQLTLVTTKEVRAQAPLSENSNHMGTAFGGSLYSLLVLTAYSWLYSALNRQGFDCKIVIQTGEIQYLAPVAQTIETVCRKPQEPEWDSFLNTLSRKSRARINLKSFVNGEIDPQAVLLGAFVVFKNESQDNDEIGEGL